MIRSAVRLFQALDGAIVFKTNSRAASGLAHEEARSMGNDSDQDYLTAVIAHGLLGQARNFRSFASKLASEAARASGRPWRIFALDLRCHGNSTHVPGLQPPHTIQTSAADILQFVDSKLGGRSPDVICGHSLGGKVVLSFCEQAAQQGRQLPSHTWILDSQPGLIDPSKPSDVDRVLGAVQNVRVPLANREALYEALRPQGFSDALLFWMGSSLVSVKGQPELGLTWTFDVPGAVALYRSYQDSDYWHLLRNPPGGTVHVVRAELSDRWTGTMVAEVDAAVAASQTAKGRTVAHVLAKAGHWLHADQPTQLRQMMLPSFVSAASNS